MNMLSYVYSTSSLLYLSDSIKKESFSFPFLESFVGKYSQKVSEDRKTPLFSKTSKYNSFPVRCKWNNDKKQKQKDKWRNANSVKKPTKIIKNNGIKGFVINILNKITENNIDVLSSKMVDYIKNNHEKNEMEIIAISILEKVWYDKGFYELYIKICEKLWKCKEWNISYTIHTKKGKYEFDEFYYTLFTSSKMYGPYKNKNELETYIQKNISFKTILIILCKDYFCKKNIFINKLKKEKDQGDQYKLKRKIFGTIQLLGYMYKLHHISDNIIHYIFLSLLHSDSKTQKGCVHEEEIEACKLLWDIVSDLFSKEEKEEYIRLFTKEQTKWSPRIRFMIEDIISNNQSNKPYQKPQSNNQSNKPYQKPQSNNQSNKPYRKPQSNNQPNKPYQKSQQNNQSNNQPNKPYQKLQPNNQTNDFIKIVSLSRKRNIESIKPFLQKSQIQEILVHIVKDIMEYHEYISNHIQVIDFCIKEYIIKYTTMCTIFSKSCIDLPDILIDAPRATRNIQECIDFIHSMYEKDIKISYTEKPESIEEIHECIEKLEHIFY